MTAFAERPSDALARLRGQLLDVAAKHHASNVGVFGSVATGDDTTESDLDLIVHFSADASLYDQVALIEELRELLGFDVDVISDGSAGAESIAPVIAA